MTVDLRPHPLGYTYHATYQDLAEALAAATGRWALCLELISDPAVVTPEEVSRAARPILPQGQADKLWCEGSLTILFENEADATSDFACVVGDDGPTEKNPDPGPARIHATLFGPNGPTRENT